MSTRCALRVVAACGVAIALGVMAAGALAAQAGADPAAGHVHAAAGDGGFFRDFFKTYMPRRACKDYEAPLIWLHVVADTLIAAAYFSIPIALVYFVRRRRDLSFNWMFVLFALFIVACGTTHIFGVLAIWKPVYKVDGMVKVVTALLSVGTAIVLWPLIPRAIALPSPATFQAANASLLREVQERTQVETTLRELSTQLEQRVEARTTELQKSNALLHAENDARRQAELAERDARREMENASRAKDEFLANLSHELRTPLNVILGWSQILRGGKASEKLEDGLEIIESNARLQAQLINDLLEMSRIVSGKLSLDVRRTDLVEVIEGALHAMHPAAEAKSLRVEKILDPAAGPISGDPARLHQVMWNLLSNAIKFTPKGGKVQVLLERVNSHVELTVADTGEGIPPEFLPHLFERFRQSDASTTRAHGGLGLGLSITKHLVELHGGTIRAASAGKGKGTTIVVSLPLIAAHHGDGQRPHPRAEPGTAAVPTGNGADALLAGLDVLVVDDEPDATRLVRTILEQHGAKVRTAGSASEAFDAFQARKPDVLVSDIGMPEEDGYALLRRIRALAPDQGGAVPAVALTAFARYQDRARVLLAGFHTHLAKPVEAIELVAVVANAAGRTGRAGLGAAS